MKLTITAKLRPTENSDKVVDAILNLFPSVKYKIEDNTIFAEAYDELCLDRFFELVGAQKIMDTTRTKLENCYVGGMFIFSLNRLAATAKQVNFGKSALDPIQVSIECETPQKVLRHLIIQGEH